MERRFERQLALRGGYLVLLLQVPTWALQGRPHRVPPGGLAGWRLSLGRWSSLAFISAPWLPVLLAIHPKVSALGSPSAKPWIARTPGRGG